ncbi:hypothetical protein GCM10009592_14780 [Brachybacterium rhamnosum]|uniref:DUF4926 domain-containing protein n=1 Tax=Brachybacterium rhamnosum TaxID=173361 RepID=A0ABW4PX58_9MICO
MGARVGRHAQHRRKGNIMVQGKDLTKSIVGKRIRVSGASIVEGVVAGVGFQDFGVQLRLEPVVEPYGVSVTVKDDTEVEVLDAEG